MSQQPDPSLYQGTAWYYSRFRPAYPAALVTILRDKFGLDGAGRLLDLGCGPGPVAIRLAHLFEQVVAIDPEPEMLAEGRACAERAGVSNVKWIAGSSEDLSPALGTFRLVTMGNSFHWMDRARTLDALYDLIINGGGLAVVGHGAPFQAPPPTAWRIAINRVVRKYLGDRSLPWDQDRPPPPEERHDAYLMRSRFKDVTAYQESFDIEWTIDSMIGNLYSTSFCSRRLLGDRAEAFERDLRAAVLAVEPSGMLRGEPPEFFAYIGRKS
ncbi:MAG: class I SAM-dependent methyltransferase [Candidatus Binataceae bacterium]